MNILIREDWRTVELVPGFALGKCVVSSSFPLMASKIVPTDEQVEHAYLVAKFLVAPVTARFGAFQPTSWIRNAELNYAVGGVANSGHLIGSAVDWISPEAEGGMQEVYDFITFEWPGELFFYRKLGHCHADLPRLGVWADKKIMESRS